jgi:F0F1-type ATP synthase assembly protein I
MGDPASNKDKDKDAQDQNLWRQVGRYSHLGLILPASVVVGMGIGALLDRWLHTKWIMLVGLLLGSVAGFFELTREIIRSTKET